MAARPLPEARPGDRAADDSTARRLTDDLGTFPRSVMFFVAFSFAMRIRCFGAIVLARSNSLGKCAAAGEMRDARRECPTTTPYACPPGPASARRVAYVAAPRCYVRRRVRRVTREVARQPRSLVARATLSPPRSTERLPRARPPN